MRVYCMALKCNGVGKGGFREDRNTREGGGDWEQVGVSTDDGGTRVVDVMLLRKQSVMRGNQKGKRDGYV